MPDYLHRTTKNFLKSIAPADLPEPIGNYIEYPDLSAVAGWDQKYWVITGDDISLADQATRDAIDAAEANQLVLDNRAKAIADIDGLADTGINRRELIELFNKRDNYIINRIIELQTLVLNIHTQIVTSTGAAQNTRDAVNTVDTTLSPTATRTRAEAVQQYKADINAGLADG